tara:strand:+ start:697 stop:1236 length:540 start_codon:yes stop_codon:yes gene_type:complete
MHRFQPGDDNPVLNDKLLREAFEAGRLDALNEQMGGGGNQFAAGGMPTPGAARQLGSRAMADAMYGTDSDIQNYTGYGPGPMERGERPFGGRMGSASGKGPVDMQAGKIPPGPGTRPGGVYDPQDGTPPQEVVPECPFPMPKGSDYKWVNGQWMVIGPNGYPYYYYAYPPGRWMPVMAM